MSNPLLWVPLVAPSLSDFEALAQESFGRLPANYRKLCDGLVIRIEDFPTNEVLDELGAKSEFDILGLFRGTALPYRHTADQTPNTVFLYRRPILDYWAEHPEPLGALVMHVLVHHIGNHFGLSNEDIAEIEADRS
jgi:predicted Zn-dependent protease with MMP-like domain